MSEDAFRIVVTVAVALACISFLVQAAVVLALYRLAQKLQQKITPVVERAGPILDTVRRIADENAPKVREISGKAAEISANVTEISKDAVQIAKTTREQVTRIGGLVGDATDRAKAKLARIDQTVDGTVEQAQHVGGAVKSAVLKPVKEVNGILAGIKAAASILAHGRRASVDHATQDEEMFI